jgi:hypothetical protein
MADLDIKLHKEIDAEIIKEYEQFMGIDSKDTSCQIFSRDEQIERYAKTLVIFRLLAGPLPLENANLQTMDMKQKIRLSLLSQYMTDTLDRIQQSFDKEMRKEIFDRSKIILEQETAKKCERKNSRDIKANI